MLSQSPGAIRQRRYTAKIRASKAKGQWGRKPDLIRHARLIEAYDLAKSKGEWALDRLVIREGYAHRTSLLQAYRLSQKVLSSLPADPVGRGEIGRE